MSAVVRLTGLGCSTRSQCRLRASRRSVTVRLAKGVLHLVGELQRQAGWLDENRMEVMCAPVSVTIDLLGELIPLVVGVLEFPTDLLLLRIPKAL